MKTGQEITTNVADREKIPRSSIDNTKDSRNVNTEIEKGRGSQSSVREKVPAEKHHLNQRDRKMHVEDRGIPEEWVIANCRSVDKKGAAQWLYGDEKLADRVKYTGVVMEGANGHGQYRPNTAYKPISAGEKDKALKYHSRPGEDYDIMLPIHPEDKFLWDNPEDIRQKYCFNINGTPYLLLTEGLFKAIVGLLHGYATVAVKGVEMGLTPSKKGIQEKRYVVDGLEKLCLLGFGVIICFDSDLSSKDGVKRALYTLGEKLSKLTKVMVVEDWSDEGENCKGMDDLIKNKGIEAFRDRLQKSISFQNWSNIYEKEKAEEKEEKERGTEGAIVEELVSQNRTTLKYHTKNKEWYQYEAKLKGVWSPIDEGATRFCENQCDCLRHQRS